MNELGPAIYMDASALVKLARPEPESSELVAFVNEKSGVLTSSVISDVELVRAIRRNSPERETAARNLLGRMVLLPVTANIRGLAQRINPTTIRSLDAIHIGTALEIAGDLGTIVSYDQRMIEAAGILGLPVSAPGVSDR